MVLVKRNDCVKVSTLIEKEGQSMDTKQITVTLTLPKKFESLHALEMAIDAEGQRIKQQLFETELQAVIDDEKQNVSQKPLACPDCEKKIAFSGEASKDNSKL